MKNLKIGSTEWQTHLRRSLAQRKRHGKINTKVEEEVSYILSKTKTAKKEKTNITTPTVKHRTSRRKIT